ncbi:DUF899 family protein [Micromonospora sp. NPDC048868]|uniref:DUF899 family protein n=1 Tax=Micromonospora sp. NPDC048868 TaxID=3364258 RepID=UPI00371145BA
MPTSGRSITGEEPFMLVFDLLDLTPYGRQESWEDSPEGWPQEPTYSWMRLHDRYGAEADPCAHHAAPPHPTEGALHP